MKRIVAFVLAVVALFCMSTVAFAEKIDLSAMSTEELNILMDEIKAELKTRNQDADGIPVFDGKNKVCVYEDEDVMIEFAGINRSVVKYLIPNVFITNKTDKPLQIKTDWRFYLNKCQISLLNAGEVEIMANGKFSFLAYSSGYCCFDPANFEMYDEDTITEVVMPCYSGGKEITWSVKCDIPLSTIHKS